VAKRKCEGAPTIVKPKRISTRTSPKKVQRHEADAIYKAIQQTKIGMPQTDCISPIGEQLLLSGMYHVVPAEFYVASTRPPNVYRGNPFQIEVALAYGGASAAQKVTFDVLTELISESDARTIKQFLIYTFGGLGADGADKIVKAAGLGTRQSPAKLGKKELKTLHESMHSVNLDSGSSMDVMRYANRVPLQFQPGACAITQSVMQTNWRSYGLTQSRGNLPSGPVTIMVHMASVWVPFTSESKEAVASYPEITKELRLGLQAVGRKLGMYLRRRKKVKQEGDRRATFLRYLGEVATAVNSINDTPRDTLYDDLVALAKKKTAEADAKFDKHGKRVADEEDDLDLGDNVIIVKPEEAVADLIASTESEEEPEEE
jgi:DNA topoisomerase-6 subunit B